MVKWTVFPRTINRTRRLFSLSLSLSLSLCFLFLSYSHSYCLSFSLPKEWDPFRSVLPSSQIPIILHLHTSIHPLRIQVPAGAWKHGFKRLQCWFPPALWWQWSSPPVLDSLPLACRKSRTSTYCSSDSLSFKISLLELTDLLTFQNPLFQSHHLGKRWPVPGSISWQKYKIYMAKHKIQNLSV